jgi:hypothetical protein
MPTHADVFMIGFVPSVAANLQRAVRQIQRVKDAMTT